MAGFMKLRSKKISNLLVRIRKIRKREAAELKRQKVREQREIVKTERKERVFRALLEKQFKRIDSLEKKLSAIIIKNKLKK